MVIKVLQQDFAVCKVEDFSKVDLEDEFCFTGKTDEEFSLVCREDLVPSHVTECDKVWKAFRIQGILDFSLIGILSKISGILADNGIGICAISTFNTDYILIKKENFKEGINSLSESGYKIVE